MRRQTQNILSLVCRNSLFFITFYHFPERAFRTVESSAMAFFTSFIYVWSVECPRLSLSVWCYSIISATWVINIVALSEYQNGSRPEHFAIENAFMLSDRTQKRCTKLKMKSYTVLYIGFKDFRKAFDFVRTDYSRAARRFALFTVVRCIGLVSKLLSCWPFTLLPCTSCCMSSLTLCSRVSWASFVRPSALSSRRFRQLLAVLCRRCA